MRFAIKFKEVNIKIYDNLIKNLSAFAMQIKIRKIKLYFILF